jgi:hypothetical protein
MIGCRGKARGRGIIKTEAVTGVGSMGIGDAEGKKQPQRRGKAGADAHAKTQQQWANRISQRPGRRRIEPHNTKNFLVGTVWEPLGKNDVHPTLSNIVRYWSWKIHRSVQVILDSTYGSVRLTIGSP